MSGKVMVGRDAEPRDTPALSGLVLSEEAATHATKRKHAVRHKLFAHEATEPVSLKRIVRLTGQDRDNSRGARVPGID